MQSSKSINSPSDDHQLSSGFELGTSWCRAGNGISRPKPLHPSTNVRCLLQLKMDHLASEYLLMNGLLSNLSCNRNNLPDLSCGLYGDPGAVDVMNPGAVACTVLGPDPVLIIRVILDDELGT
jgi:hypothetical protein